MRILIIGNCNSAHLRRWVHGLLNFQFELAVWSISAPTDDFYDQRQVKIFHASKAQSKTSLHKKLNYLLLCCNLKRAIKWFEPDILHAHYATSYGLLARLSGFKPYMISVWGSDVFTFPKKSPLHLMLLKRNLKKAHAITSTSYVMKAEALQYVSADITVIPFGVDLNFFKPQFIEKDYFAFGTVKALERVYGIDILINAFALFKKKFAEESVRLILVGGGSQETKLRELAKILGVSDSVDFVGLVSLEEVPYYQNLIDCSLCLSRNESFGVSALESSTVGKPVIVSNVGGLPEIILDEKTGIVVPSEDVFSASEAMVRVFKDAHLRKELGEKGMQRSVAFYSWQENLKSMVEIYNRVYQDHH